MGHSFLSWTSQGLYHPGADFNYGDTANADLGQDVISPASGFVEYVSPKGKNGGLGNYLVICHPQLAVWTRYMHLQDFAPGIEIGTKIMREQLIGFLGKTGSSSPHLHFEVLNALGRDFIRYHTLPYGRYTKGLTKAKVKQFWIEPMEWITTNNDPPKPTKKNLKIEAENLRLAIARAIDEERRKLLQARLKSVEAALKRI